MGFRSALFRSIRAVLSNARFRMLLLGLSLGGILFTIVSLSTSGYSEKRVYFNNQTITKRARYDHIAIALKTGENVALKRTPIQFLTFLSPVKNVIMIGEAPGVWVGNVPMVDVYTNLYSKKEKRSIGAELIPDENSPGWKADAHKNIPVVQFK
jgi:hypothetical protein